MSKITYALPSFAGQLTADDRNRIGAISRKAQRRGVSCTDFDIDDLIIDSVDRKLFSHITDPNHCLYHLLPPTAHRSYSLRKGLAFYVHVFMDSHIVLHSILYSVCTIVCLPISY